MNPQRISFARTLPILALLLSYVIITVPATMFYAHLRHVSQHGGGVRFHSHRHDFTIQPKDFLRTSILGPVAVTSRPIQALNMPGFLIEWVVDPYLGTAFTQWRPLIFPICCLPFWWFAGIGIDALTTGRRRSWWVLLLGSIFCIFTGVVATGLWFGISKADRNGLIFPYLGLGLWFILLGAYPITWIKQWRARRRTKTSLQARLFAELQ
jgi:hypothetical protein